MLSCTDDVVAPTDDPADVVMWGVVSAPGVESPVLSAEEVDVMRPVLLSPAPSLEVSVLGGVSLDGVSLEDVWSGGVAVLSVFVGGPPEEWSGGLFPVLLPDDGEPGVPRVGGP